MAFTEDFKRLMDEYDRCRAIWEAKYGVDREAEFHAAFSKHVGL